MAVHYWVVILPKWGCFQWAVWGRGDGCSWTAPPLSFFFSSFFLSFFFFQSGGPFAFFVVFYGMGLPVQWDLL